MSLELKKRVKKLVSVSTTFTSIITSKKEAFKTAETAEAVDTVKASEDGKKSKGSKYPKNLI